MDRTVLRLGRTEFGPDELVVMGIVNRTPDSFYDHGATFADDAAMARVERIVAEGARIVDIGGVKAGAGAEVDVAQEIDRVAGFTAEVRAAFPELVISVDTWRAEVAEAVCRAGADLLNDAWGGYDPALAQVAAQYKVGLVCAHTGGTAPRTVPDRAEYRDLLGDVLGQTLGLARRAVGLGVPRESILIDPAHDFGKNTLHSLEVTRRLEELTETGWPVLVALSNKDFVGESLDVPPDGRLTGTLAATAVCAWLGARVFRAHEVHETRQLLDMIGSIRGTRPPANARRALA